MDIFRYTFFDNALIASSVIAVVAGWIGYFMVTRRLTFAGHALSHIGFAGAAGALLIGADPVFGLLAFTVAAAIGIGVSGKSFRDGDVNIGVIMTLMLGFGALFVSLYRGYAEEAYSILFGTILGISRADVIVTAWFGVIVIAVLAALCRPLLFSSIDPEVAEARGVPVRTLAVAFLVLVAIAVSMSVQVVGVLLVFTLLIGPAATATRIVRSPAAAISLSIALALAYAWFGIFLAASGSWPVSFYIASLSFGVYLPVRIFSPFWMERDENLKIAKAA